MTARLFNMVCSANPEHKWTAVMFYETGGWFFQNDDQASCPICGADHDNADHGEAEDPREHDEGQDR